MTTNKTRTLDLGVASDHVERLATKGAPHRGVEELIWNALDADADNVVVSFETNELDALVKVTVTDDGTGIRPDDIEETFGHLGGSPKRGMRTTPKGRFIHGKAGQGRFRAFVLGGHVEWASTFGTGGSHSHWTVRGRIENLTKFPLSSPKVVKASKTGTIVTVANIRDGVTPASVTSDRVRRDLLTRLALYLKSYPGVAIVYDGKKLDVGELQTREASYEVTEGTEGGAVGELIVVEWAAGMDRKLYLCGRDGFARLEIPPGIQAPGFDFTAYLLADCIGDRAELEVDLVEMDPTVAKLVDSAKRTLKDHFKAREAEQVRGVVQQWKDEGVYPYAEEPGSPLGKVEREVFDICAISIHDRLPAFSKLDSDSKKLTMRLVRQALETNPGSLQTILQEVLGLPKQLLDDLADLLQRHKLSAVIRASKVVSDRLTFIESLKLLIFDPGLNKRLKERSQLQRILVNELWVFGDVYHLGTDDQSLKALLEKHAKVLGREVLAEEVKDLNGDQAIPDLMLYRRYADRAQGTYEHLVVELKRPSVKIGAKEIEQIKKYAHAVAKDPRFDKTNTRWVFVVVSTDLDDFAEQECQLRDRAYGHIMAGDNVDIYVKRWSAIIQDCEWRYGFYRQAFEAEVQTEDAVAYLNEKHSKYLPGGSMEAAQAPVGKKSKKKAQVSVTA